MKQIWPTYAYSPTTNVLTLTGLNIDRDQLLLVTAADRGRIMYNFADSSVTASAFTSGANTALTLVATTAGLTTTAALVIYYDDQLASTTVTVSSLPAISGTVVARNNGINNDPWIYIPRLTMSHPDTGSVVLDGYYRFDGVNTWGNSNLNNNYPAYLARAADGDQYAFSLIVHDESNEQDIVFASGSSLSPDFPTSMSPSAGTLVSGSLTFNTEQRESYGVRLTNSVTVGNTVTIAGTVTANPTGTQTIAGTVTVGNTVTITGTVTANPTGTQTIAGSVTIAAGTAQIGSVTASISGTVPVSISSVTVGNSITIGSCVTHGVTIANTSVTVNGTFYQATQPVSLTTLPALVAGTAQIGSVTASISNTVVTFYPSQGTSVSNTNFTSITASTSLVSAVAGREVLTVFNEGAGNLHISPGATCTTVAYQVRLSAGDYWECPQGQLSIAHTAVFATAGTARVTEVS